MRIAVPLLSLVVLAAVGVFYWSWQGPSPVAQSEINRDSAPDSVGDTSSNVLESTPPATVGDSVVASDVEKTVGLTNDSSTPSKPADLEQDTVGKSNRTSGGDSPSPDDTFFQAALSVEPIPFEDLCFRSSDLIPPTREQLQQWVEPVQRQKGSMNEVRTRDGQCMVLDGVHRLLAPWAERRVLRLSISPKHRWHLYLYHGDTGLALHWDLRQATFVAYVVSRHDSQVLPYRYALAATDQGRARRALPRPPVPLDLRYQDQELIVSCGDIAILRAPMSGIPQDVFWEGNAEVHGLTLSPSLRFPDPREEQPVSLDVQRPGELSWSGEFDDAGAWKQTDEGAVVLTARDAKQPGWIIAPLPRRGLQLVDAQVSGITPGTAVLLVPEGRQPGVGVRFLQDRRSKRTCATLSHNANESTKSWNEPTKGLVPFVGDSVWIRFIYGAGVLRWWLSCDGKNWAESDVFTTGMREPVTHIGLQYAAGGPQRRIQLDRLVFRELTTFPRLIPASLRSVEVVPPVTADLDEWRVQVMNLKPESVNDELWQRVMAVRALEQGCDSKLGAELLNGLLDDSTVRQLPTAERVKFVADTALLVGQPIQIGGARTTWDRYFEIGTDAWWQNGESPFTSVRRDVMEAMFVRYHQPRWDFESVIRLELLSLLGESQWQKLRETIRVLDFYRLAENQPLVDWARRRANEELGGQQLPAPQRKRVFSWQPPYAEELSREAYNAVIELKTLVASGSFEDAARSIGNARLDRIAGVTPSLSDAGLRFSPRVAVHATLNEVPELARCLEQEYGQLAQLRVRQGMDDGNAATVRQAVEQFVGTRAAAEGQVWLGDLQLARGNGGAAFMLYRKALCHAKEPLKSNISPRLVLAAAMKGKRAALQVQGPVQIGEHELTPEQFSELVEDLLTREMAFDDTATPVSLTELASLKVLERKPVSLRIGEEPERSLLPGIDQLRVDWSGRQLHAVVQNDTLLVSNRFELLALDADTLAPKWSSRRAGEKLMQGLDWGLIPMRPLVRQSRVVCRQLYQPQPVMVCFDFDTGELLWANRDEDRVFASDPFILNEQLACLTMTRRQQFVSVLQLAHLDETTGQVLDTFDILRVRDSWWVRRCCETLVCDEGLVVVLGGVAAAVDGEGHVLWIRESEAIPIEADLQTVRQHFRPAVLADSRLLVAQPGVHAVECLDPSTGILLWDRVLPDIEAIVGVRQNSVIVRLHRYIASLDIATGGLLWLRNLEGQMLAAHCFAHDGLIVSREVQPDPNRKELCPQLLLLNADTGDTIQELTLESLMGEQPRLGPLIAVRDHLITFWGNGQRVPTRELILLAPP